MTVRRLLGSRLAHVPSADWRIGHLRALISHSERSRAVASLEEEVTATIGLECVAFGDARTAIWAALVTAPKVRRVWIPSFTCVAVPNAVRAAGLEICWADVNGPNIDLGAVIPKARTGDALIAQHTYGIPIDPAQLREARELGLFVVEDRAHRFDADDVVGNAVVYSLEHSKVVSGGHGGLLNVADGAQRDAVALARHQLHSLDADRVRHVVLTSIGQLAFDWHAPVADRVGALVRRLLLRLPATSIASQSDEELAGKGIERLAMHPLLASVALEGVRGLAANLAHRKRIGRIYAEGLAEITPGWVPADRPLVRFPVIVEDADALQRQVRRSGVDLGVRWFAAPIHPPGSRSTYVVGTAPAAERLARTVVTLPTHARVSATDAERITEAVLAAASLT